MISSGRPGLRPLRGWALGVGLSSSPPEWAGAFSLHTADEGTTIRALGRSRNENLRLCRRLVDGMPFVLGRRGCDRDPVRRDLYLRINFQP